jgi:YegS/Rv2252/BmrU family lipid kinase
MYDFVVNPVAGRGKSKKNMKKIAGYLTAKNILHTISFSTKIGESLEITKRLIENGSKNIVAVGGDGTVGEVLNGMTDLENCNLGIIPSGTGNDFAMALGIPEDPIKAIDLILKGQPAYTDFIEMSTRRCINVAGCGIDVDVLKRCKKMKLIKGKPQYYISLLITLIRYKFIRFKIKIDGAESEHRGFIAAVCNGKYFGSGIKVSPESDLSDGKLNVVIINEMKRRKILGHLLRLMRGTILESKYTKHVLCESVEIIGEKPITVNVDGELFDGEPFKCNVVTGKLKVFRA